MPLQRRSRPPLLAFALDTLLNPALAAPPPVLTLDCAVSGGGYAIRSPAGDTLENGDGAPFALPPRATLRITAAPPGLRVMQGTLPHPDCAASPVLDSFESVRFRWCQARYELTPEEPGAYHMRSTSSSPLTTGPQQGNVMEAFMVGRCVPSPSR